MPLPVSVTVMPLPPAVVIISDDVANVQLSLNLSPPRAPSPAGAASCRDAPPPAARCLLVEGLSRRRL
jgi:hypothetical protein